MVYTGTPGDQYADRPLPGSTTLCGLYHLIWVSGGNDRDFNRYRSIPLVTIKINRYRPCNIGNDRIFDRCKPLQVGSSYWSIQRIEFIPVWYDTCAYRSVTDNNIKRVLNVMLMYVRVFWVLFILSTASSRLA
ncbi:hypothetical protein BHM03_00025393, partial [Ensete ventricosum]